MTVKFDQKNVAILGKLQAVEGTPVNPVASDGLAVIELSAEVTRETESYEYKGDSLSRDEFTTLKDTFADIPAQTLMPTLGTLDAGLAAVDAPLYQWFTACNANATVDGTGAVTFANDVEVNKLLTIDYFKSSPEVSVPGEAKRQRFSDCRGLVDITFEAGSRAVLDFKFLGNDSVPTMETNLVPDLGTQIEDVASVVRLVNMQNSSLTEILGTQPILTISNITGSGTEVTVDFAASHNILAGQALTISGTTNYNFDFVVTSVTDADTLVLTSTISAGAETVGTGTAIKGVPQQMCTNNGNFTNFFGFDYERYLMTCQEGFSKKAVPSDVSITVLEDEVGGTDFDPEANIEKFFEINIKWGTGAGAYVALFFEKVQLTDSKDTAIGSFFGKELSMRNTGKTKLILS